VRRNILILNRAAQLLKKETWFRTPLLNFASSKTFPWSQSENSRTSLQRQLTSISNCVLSRIINATLPLSHWLYSPLDLGCFFRFLIVSTVARTPCTGEQPIARPLLTHRTTQTRNKRTQTSDFRVGFEPTNPRTQRSNGRRPRGLSDRQTLCGTQQTVFWDLAPCIFG
jgi:hypothetical protein